MTNAKRHAQQEHEDVQRLPKALQRRAFPRRQRRDPVLLREQAARLCMIAREIIDEERSRTCARRALRLVVAAEQIEAALDGRPALRVISSNGDVLTFRP
jgi:hypothetical protein